MKKFSQLFSEASAKDYIVKKDDDKEAKTYKPRSKGEEEFADKHEVEVDDHPVADDAQHSAKTKEADHKASGEKQVIKQGSSEQKAKGKTFRHLKQHDVAGEKETVKQGSSKLKEEVELSESVVDTLKKIVKQKGADEVTFKNKKKLKVDMQTANALLKIHDALKPGNAKKFRDNLEKGEANFMRMVDFAFSNLA